METKVNKGTNLQANNKEKLPAFKMIKIIKKSSRKHNGRYKKKRKHKNKDLTYSNTFWRPVSPPTKGSNKSHEQEQEAAGIANIQSQNIFSNLGMQEYQETDKTVEEHINKTTTQHDQPKNGSHSTPYVINRHNTMNE